MNGGIDICFKCPRNFLFSEKNHSPRIAKGACLVLDLKCPPQSTCGSSAPRMVVLLGTMGTLRGQCRSQPVELPWEVVGLGWWRSLKVKPDPACSPILRFSIHQDMKKPQHEAPATTLPVMMDYIHKTVRTKPLLPLRCYRDVFCHSSEENS